MTVKRDLDPSRATGSVPDAAPLNSPMTMNVVLIGMKHCGKSTIGQALADRWQCPFHDVDEMLAAAHACSTGRRLAVRDIFAELGEERFQQLESQVVCELYLRLARPGAHAVVAVGGRTALNPQIRELLSGIGRVVFLQVAPEELLARVQRSGLPPFLNDADPAGDFLKLCHQREPQYRALADVAVDLNNISVAAAVERLAELLADPARS